MNPKSLKREAFWFIGAIAIGYILAIFLFRSPLFEADTTLDINIHDTYFVLPSLPFALSFIIFVVFLVFLIRAIKIKFQNQYANTILILATIGIQIVIGKGIGFLELIGNSHEYQCNLTVTGPLAEVIVVFARILVSVQVIFMFLLVFLGVKFGQNLKRKKEGS